MLFHLVPMFLLFHSHLCVTPSSGPTIVINGVESPRVWCQWADGTIESNP